VHPYGQRVPALLLGGTEVRNVTGWHLLEIRPGTGVREVLPARSAPDRPAPERPIPWRPAAARGHGDVS
jgi:hypothetical protein